MATQVRPHRGSDSHRTVVDGLARELDMPVDEVESVYLSEVSRLEAGARITTFVSVLAAGSARSRLRRHRRHDH